MLFRRGIFGISNQHLFYNVDYVIYVEGGHSFSKDEVYSGMCTEDTLDIIFWKKIFSNLNSNKKTKYKSVGSKTTLKSIAEDIIDFGVTTLYVAMDSEFDRILNLTLKNKYILYTHGYSWENDVWNLNSIYVIINTISGDIADYSQIERVFKKFEKNIKIGVYADSYLFKKGKSFFPRPNHNKCLICDLKVEPELKLSEIQDLLSIHSLKKQSLYGYASRNKINSLDHCYGHLLDDFFCFFIIYFLKVNFGIKNVNKDVIRRISISLFDDVLKKDIKYKDYYKLQFV